MWGLLFSAIPGLAGQLLGFLNKRADINLETYKIGTGADVEINMALLRAHGEALKTAAASRAADRQSLWTVWMMPVAFGLCIFHFACIMFDSIPLFGHIVGSWHVAGMPGQYLTMELGILASATGVVMTDRITSVVRRIFVR